MWLIIFNIDWALIKFNRLIKQYICIEKNIKIYIQLLTPKNRRSKIHNSMTPPLIFLLGDQLETKSIVVGYMLIKGKILIGDDALIQCIYMHDLCMYKIRIRMPKGRTLLEIG